jgi:antitoxin (DNA-binding transcriptional repressor) of toxin-antitoxin stability system
MKVSISDARRRLPELVKKVRAEAGTIQITLRDEVVAELRPALPEPPPGAAARALLALARRLPRRSGRQNRVSSDIKAQLYGRAGR